MRTNVPRPCPAQWPNTLRPHSVPPVPAPSKGPWRHSPEWLSASLSRAPLLPRPSDLSDHSHPKLRTHAAVSRTRGKRAQHSLATILTGTLSCQEKIPCRPILATSGALWEDPRLSLQTPRASPTVCWAAASPSLAGCPSLVRPHVTPQTSSSCPSITVMVESLQERSGKPGTTGGTDYGKDTTDGGWARRDPEDPH